ncbi:hypothetical protein BROUX41_005911 [Berkeleyomyces rouxiae]|uniref:uncharacterized protein n=1 Tax=Berkeleyomyces rouxiae TaxID=2035830 RepID=UPI003B802EA1
MAFLLDTREPRRLHRLLFAVRRVIFCSYVRFPAVAAVILFLLAIPVYWTLEDHLPHNIPFGSGKCAGVGDIGLRIMPLGASITKGEPAQKSDPHHNGYRKFLRDKLRSEGWAVNMVGSVRSWGDMADLDNEGHPGWKVNQVHGRAKNTVPLFKPNIILVNVGTNDAFFSSPELPYEEAPKRMEAMLRDIWALVPDTVIVLSTLLPKDDGGKTATINMGYRALGKKLAAEEKPILMAEMDNKKTVLTSDIWDGTHPVVAGFKKMAGAWYSAIYEAHCRGLIKDARTDVLYTDGEANSTCSPTAGASRADDRSGQMIISGTSEGISNDGPFKPKFSSAPVSVSATASHNSSVMFASLVSGRVPVGGGSGTDDLVIVDGPKVSVMQGSGNGTFVNMTTLEDLPFHCDQAGIRFGDVNNDGLDDLLCIGANSSVQAAINTGTNPISFRSIGLWHNGIDGYQRNSVRFGDIDGDGRLDYCLLNTKEMTGKCWRNKGTGEIPSAFQELSLQQTNVFDGVVKDVASVRFVDINGDHRFDWIQISEDGTISIKANQRSISKGFIPEWVPSPDLVTLPGYNAPTNSHEAIQFGRIFGTGQADAALVSFSNCTAASQCTLSILGFKNTGSGGKFQIGDGTHFADMRNRKIHDYVWISPSGELLLRRNLNSASNASRLGDASYATSISILNTETDRRALHLADWDSDGYADVIAVNKTTGQLKIWLNKHARSKSDMVFKFDVIHINQTTCSEGWGVGYTDNGNHFADLDGDGRADVICMSPNGLATAWLNKAGGLQSIGQISPSSHHERANFRFVDANGDGKADMYAVHEITGDAQLWLNSGLVDQSERGTTQGNSIVWDAPRSAWFGSTTGRNEHFTDQLGNGRSDLVSVNPAAGNVVVYLTVCPGSGDDSYQDLSGIPNYDYESEVAK